MTDEEAENVANLRQTLAYQANRIEHMAVALTRSGLDNISLKVALAVEDEFAKGQQGRTQRLAKVQVLIRSAVEYATRGEVAWNTWSPGSCGPAPQKPVGNI